MIISELPENEAACANTQTQTQKLTKAFWGVKVSPLEPVTVSFDNPPRKSLFVCQATLGELCLEAIDRETDGRSLLSMKKGDNPEIVFCSLRMRLREMSRLDILLEGPGDVVFSVEGPFDIHLIGYMCDYCSSPAIQVEPPKICGNEGGSVGSTSLLASSSKSQLSSSGGGSTCQFSTESASNPDLFSHLPLLNIPNLSHLRAVDIVDGLNTIRKEGSINILLQGLTLPQIEALRDIMVDKLQETNSVRRKLDYRVVNEVEARVIGQPEESGFNGNEVEERVEQVATQGTNLVICYNEDTRGSKNDVEAEVEYIATRGTTHVIDTNDESGVNGNGVERLTEQGSPDHYMLRSRKSKRLKHEEEEENVDHIRSAKHDSVQDPLLDSKEARRLKKKLKKQKHAEDDDTRSTKHDSVQDPLLDSKEARRLKRKLKKQKHAEDDDTRAANDGLNTSTFEHDDSVRSPKHGLPEDSEVDTKDAIKARKKRKRDAREEARSTRNGSPEYHVLQSRKSKTLKKHKNHDDDQDDQIRSTKHESLQNPLLDSKEAKRLKKKLKKQKHAEDDDTRTAQHGLPEDSAVDTRDAKKARKKMDAKEEVRAANDDLQTPASDTVQTKKHIVEDANIGSHEAGRVIVVCALPCQGKR